MTSTSRIPVADARLAAALAEVDSAVPFRATSGHLHSNWARTFYSRPELYIQPESVAEVQRVVKLALQCRRRIVVVGSGHSPSDLTCTSLWMVNLDKLNQVLAVNTQHKTMAIQAGTRLRQLNAEAKKHGWTIPNLGSIDEQSIAGAFTTNTHGSSMYHGTLGENVQSLKIVLGDGTLKNCSRKVNQDLFRAALISLGAIGIIVEVEYRLVDDTRIEWKQSVASLDHVLDHWSTDLWTQAEFTRVWWVPYTRRAIIWRAEKTKKAARSPQSNWYGGIVGNQIYHTMLWFAHYVPRVLPTIEWFIFGMQYGFKLGSSMDAVEDQSDGLLMNCLYSQFVNEWALPISEGPEAIRRLDAWFHDKMDEARLPVVDKVWVHAPIEVRIANTTNETYARPFLENTSASEPTLYLNATLYRPYGLDPPCHKPYYTVFEHLMKELRGKPHWAKNFATMTAADFNDMYGADLLRWRQIRAYADPEGIFVGDWHARNLLTLSTPLPGRPLGGERLHEEQAVPGGGVFWTGEMVSGTSLPRPPSGSSEESFWEISESTIVESKEEP